MNSPTPSPVVKTSNHIPVMKQEVLEQLQPKPNQWYLDATFGSGGHTAALLEVGARVIALDWDAAAIEAGQDRFAKQIEAGHLLLIHAPFSQLDVTLSQLEQTRQVTFSLSGCLFDFGTSTLQLMSGERGFSFNEDGLLDMRMDTRLGVTAADLLAVLPEKQLAELFRDYGGEESAAAIAKAIKRQPTPIATTQQLVRIIEQVKHGRRTHLHPATKTFQALRIAVNTELEEITAALPQALKWLEKHGVLVSIAFHEGEDRIVKHTFREWQEERLGTMISKKPILPTEQEITSNPRARSAKLRAFTKEIQE